MTENIAEGIEMGLTSSRKDIHPKKRELDLKIEMGLLKSCG